MSAEIADHDRRAKCQPAYCMKGRNAKTPEQSGQRIRSSLTENSTAPGILRVGGNDGPAWRSCHRFPDSLRFRRRRCPGSFIARREDLNRPVGASARQRGAVGRLVQSKYLASMTVELELRTRRVD